MLDLMPRWEHDNDHDAATLTKVCTKCSTRKPFSEYHAMRRGRFGLNSWCKACMNTRRVGWRTENPERQRDADNRWRAENPERVKAHYLKSVYGITVDEREALGDECMICGDSPVVVDHDHSCCSGHRSCGRCVRGVLCRGCNLALGHFDDDIERLRAALTYLERER